VHKRLQGLLVAAVLALALLVVFALEPILDAVRAYRSPFAACVRDALVLKQTFERKKAFEIGLRLQDANSPVVMTNETRGEAVQQALSDRNQRDVIEACARQHAIVLSAPVYQATMRAMIAGGRVLGDVWISLARNEGTRCRTGEGGTCDLKIDLVDAFTRKERVVAHVNGYEAEPQEVTQDQFLEGLTFTLKRAAVPVTIAILRGAKEVPRARVALDGQGAEVWSDTCHHGNGKARDGCDWEITDVNGEAKFYYAAEAPFTHADVTISIDGRRRTYGIDATERVRGRYAYEWNDARPSEPGSECKIDGDKKPNTWERRCPNPRERRGAKLTKEYRELFPELGHCATIVEYSCP
jgi:hypothetical protein